MDEAKFRSLIAGQTRGPTAAALRMGLAAMSVPYRWAVGVRNWAYGHGMFRTYSAPVPVVSVGNLTTGGTGKTPLVGWLARWFQDRGMPVALLSRGYRALPGRANDEQLVLEQLNPGLPHFQNADRVAGARQAYAESGCRVLLLDDGFQHRRLARNLDIVLVDALNPWGFGALLPRGLLREPPHALRRADLVVLTRVDQCAPGERLRLRRRLGEWIPEDQMVEVVFRPQRLMNTKGETADLTELRGERVVAFCGIGHPEAYEQTLISVGMSFVAFRPFPDHHHYTTADLQELARLAAQESAVALVATQKDLVKIPHAELAGCPIWAIEIGAEFVSGIDVLEQRLASAVSEAGSVLA